METEREKTIGEIMQQEVFDVRDIGTIFKVKSGKAYRVMREIKDYSDRLKIGGRIHRKDYEDYINRDLKGNSNYEK